MGIGLLLTISLWMPAARSQPLTFAGVWVLDGPRSDFGVATAPE